MREYFETMLHTVGASVRSLDHQVFNRLVEECQQTLEIGKK